MQQLSGLDATFLYLETSKTPMHVGSVYIFEAPEGGEMTFKAFKEYIASRLHISRTFRQRIVFSPLNLGHPYWIEDPDFNLDNHLNHIALPKPGGRKELREAAASSFAKTLDRNRPLWEITFVEGLDGMENVPKGSFAMISKVHHAGIDGGSGAELIGALLSLTHEPQKLTPAKPWQAERIPGSIELLFKNYLKVFGTPIQFVKFVVETAGTAYNVASNALNKVIEPPVFPFTAPATPFNVTISPTRSFGGVELFLDKIKAIKNQVKGTTVNDVILTICSGALRKFLVQQGKLPQKSLVAMAPVSTREENEKGQMGNKVSAMLVSLATNEPDPLRRLNLIHESSTNSKAYTKAMRATEIMDFIPSTLAALGARLYTGMKLSEAHSPFYNLVITNVPGPPMPLFMNGAKLVGHYGTAPILDGLGLLMVIFSYANTISISFTSTKEIIPDTEVFSQYLLDAYQELLDAVGKVEEKPKVIKKEELAVESSENITTQKPIDEQKIEIPKQAELEYLPTETQKPIETPAKKRKAKDI